MLRLSFRSFLKAVTNREKEDLIVKLSQNASTLINKNVRSVSSTVPNNLLLPHQLLTRLYPKGVFFPKSFSFVITMDKVTYVVYRGTELTSYVDILTDLNATKVHPFGKENGIIHQGFFHRSRTDFGISINAKEDKYDEGSILDLIGKSDSEKIIFTGHSLGGASAELSFLRYITFCENFPSNIASRFKDKSSYIAYAAPISTSIEIRNRFEKYTNQMHSIDQYNDPIVECVRDLERIFSLRDSEDVNDNYTDPFPFPIDDYIDNLFPTTTSKKLKLPEKPISIIVNKKQLTKTRKDKFIEFYNKKMQKVKELMYYNEKKKRKKNEEFVNNLIELCNDISNGLLNVTKIVQEMKDKYSKATIDFKFDQFFSNTIKDKENEKKMINEDDYFKSFGESIRRTMISTMNDMNDLLTKANDLFITNTHNISNMKEENQSKEINNTVSKLKEKTFKEYLMTTIMIFKNEFEKNIKDNFESSKGKSTEIILEEKAKNSIDELIESMNLVINYIFLSIKNLDLSPEVIQKSIDTIQQTNFSISKLIPIYEPISLPLGIHHILMKDGKLLNTIDCDVICDIYKKYREDSNPEIHRMINYAILINHLNYEK